MAALPPIIALRALEAVARTGSVGAAAEALGRTHGAVSKHLRALQDHAGISLLVKRGTGVVPTAAGLDLARATRRALDELAEAYDRIVGEARSPTIHVACSATFAMRWLVPNMSGFANRRPNVRIRLSMTSAGEMRDERDADLVILWDRSGYAPADQARAIRVGEASFVVVAAPDHPVDRTLEGVVRARVRIAHDITARAWDLWAACSGLDLRAERTVSFPHTHLGIQAALSGIGVALVESRLVAEEIRSGRLVALTPPTPFPEGFAVIPHRTRPLSPEADGFVAWLREALGREGSTP
jgi:DNA-binding transcriptional LysR family regulator